MKKKITPLMLNKKAISNLKEKYLLGGKSADYCYSTSVDYCKSECCDTKFYKNCVATYITSVTEFAFCKAF